MAYVQTDGIPDDCAEITPLLSKYIDGEASIQESQLVESHLDDCPICRGNLESMREASVTYRSLIPILPLASFKVWAGTNAALTAGGAVTTGASGTATITMGATTSFLGKIRGTLWGSLLSKVLTVVTVVILVGGAGFGVYMGIKSLMVTPKDRAESYVKEARKLMYYGKFGEALKKCDLALEVDRKCADAHVTKSAIILVQGDMSDADVNKSNSELEKALQLDSSNALAYSSRALSYAYSAQIPNQGKKAKEDIAKALQLAKDPYDTADALINNASLLKSDGVISDNYF